MKHTPGDWEIDADEESKLMIRAMKASKVFALATLGIDDNAEEQAANAMLIAAAPDLLKAVIDICNGAHLRPGKHEDYHVHPDLIERARKAWAKAENGSPIRLMTCKGTQDGRHELFSKSNGKWECDKCRKIFTSDLVREALLAKMNCTFIRV
jgi:hypothetical protein